MLAGDPMTRPVTLPQTLRRPAPIGSLFKRGREVRSPSYRRPRETDATHLDAIRQLPCLRCGLEPCGEAAHVRMTSAAHGKRGSMAAKPDDKWAVPLCPGCHRQDADSQHRVGEIAFWSALDLNPLLICESLHAASPDVLRMRAVVFTFIAGRT
jgi:hypothetical protein